MYINTILLLVCFLGMGQSQDDSQMCDFDSPQDTCGAKSVEGDWQLKSVAELDPSIDNIPLSGYDGDNQNRFYISILPANADGIERTARLDFPEVPLENSYRCFSLYVFEYGAFKWVYFYVLNQDGSVANYNGRNSDHRGWMIDRVFFVLKPNQTLSIQASTPFGETENAVLAIDHFTNKPSDELDACRNGEEPSTTRTTTISSTQPPDDIIACDFSSDFCSWSQFTANPGSGFDFTRVTSQILIDNSILGPGNSHSDSMDDYFAFLTTNSVGDGEKAFAELRSADFLADQHPMECLQFWFFFQRAPGIERFQVIQTSKPSEKVQVIWTLPYNWSHDDHMVWHEGRVEILADDTSYMVSLQVVKGEGQEGFIAIDDILFLSSNLDCEMEPQEAVPSNMTTTPQTSTVTASTSVSSTSSTTKSTEATSTISSSTTESTTSISVSSDAFRFMINPFVFICLAYSSVICSNYNQFAT